MKGFFYSENIYNALRELSPRDRSIMRDGLDAYIFTGELPLFTGMKKALFLMLKSEIENQDTTNKTTERAAPIIRDKAEPDRQTQKEKTKSEIIAEFNTAPDTDAVFIKLPRVTPRKEPREEPTPLAINPAMHTSPGVYSFASAYGITQGELFTPGTLSLNAKPKEETSPVEIKTNQVPPHLEKEQKENKPTKEKRFTRPKLDEVK